ncbi:hypothetical protein CcCBS67573_g03938 [Chytriomyces confervae]|uniref:F-box domain-containing protein n=1 Tax=Chytriomyces confervae TaxID=246404 RepID=A0A507FF72_9FUNG|nr:hypothetical protein CcCBS67573_g03938 [Chytriomyces confervae]
MTRQESNKRARTERHPPASEAFPANAATLASILSALERIEATVTHMKCTQLSIIDTQRHLLNQVQILQNRDKKFYTRLQDMPHEIIVQVFAWIPAQTVFKYRRLSKTINEALLSTQFAVLNMYMPDFQDGSMDTIGGLWFMLPPPYQTAVARALGSQVKRVVRFDVRKFKKTLPESIKYLTAVEEIDLCSFNLLSGLIYVNFTGNRLSGEFPALPNSSLETLCISYNKFTGPIPTIFGNPHKLKYLYARNNLFNSIPAAIGQFSSLEELSISENPISSKMPSEIWSLGTLHVLEMAFCNMFGSLAGVGALRNLRGLDMVNNRLCGSLREISNMHTLRSLHLSQNQFSQRAGEWVDVTGMPELFSMCVDPDIPVKGSYKCFDYHNKVTNHSDGSHSDSELESESELDASESAGSESETDSMED